MIDHFTSFGAGRLAAKIEKYWRDRGFHGIEVERYQIDKTDLFGIWSNIGPDGYPPRMVEGKEAA